MNRQVDVKALVSHIVRGDGLDKCRICMGDTTEGQVYLGDTVMMDGDRAVTLAELLETITGIEVPLEEDLPAGLCTICAQSAMDAASFRMLCKQAANQWASTLHLLANNIPKKYRNKTMYVLFENNQLTIANDLRGLMSGEKQTSKLQGVKDMNVRDVKHNCHCPDCGKKFAYAHHLYLHLKESMDFKRACYVCAEIMTRDDLILHLKSVHQQETYECRKCPAMLRSKKLLIRHKEEAHSPGACTCGDCGRSFKSQPAYNAHLSVHAAKTCPSCDKVFRNQTCYLHHVKKCCDLVTSNVTYHTKNKVSIEVKNKKNQRKTKVGLRGAADTHCICDYCGKRLAGKKFITAHIQIVHLKNTHRPCSYCGKFLAAAHMGEHLKKHEQVTIFTCEYCGIVLKTKLGYIQHIRLHTGEKPYACQYCDETFSASSRKSEHIRKRHGTGIVLLKYACEYCPARFRLPYKLRKHVIAVHDKEDVTAVQFTCKICCEKFSSLRGLTHHNRKHQKAQGKGVLKIDSIQESVESVDTSSLLPNRICGACARTLAPTIHLIEYLKDAHRKWKEAIECFDQLHFKGNVKTVYIVVDDDVKDVTTYTENVKRSEQPEDVFKHFKKRKQQQNAVRKKNELERKLRNSEINTGLKCPECEKSFLCVYKYNMHMRYYNKRACVHCKRLIKLDDLKDHYIEHGVDTLQCDICCETFKKPDGLLKHTATYHNKGRYFCYICKLSYRDPHHLASHMTSKHEPRICQGCDRKFSNVYCFRTHSIKCKNSEKKGGIFICDICAKVYSSKYALKVHLEYVHMNKELRHVCKHCGKAFNSAIHLLEHSNTHNKVLDRFVCNFCGVPMSTRRGYQRHYNRHLMNPNYVPRVTRNLTKAKHECEFCEEKFKTFSRLREHVMLAHTIDHVEIV